MKEEYSNQEKETIEALQSLQDVPDRPQENIERGKAAFLAEAKRISNQPVSISPLQRLINSFRQPRPIMRLSTLTIAIIFAAALLVSFSGSVYAARQAQPDDLLYPYKLWLEDQRLALTPRKDTQIDLLLDYAEERLREYQALGLEASDPLSAQVLEEFYHDTADAGKLLSTSENPDEQQTRLSELQTLLNQLVDKEDQSGGEDAVQPGDGDQDTNQPRTTPMPPSKTPVEDGDTDSDHADETSEPDETEHPAETQDPRETKEPNETDDPQETDTPDESDASNDSSGNDTENDEDSSETPDS